MSDQTLKYDYAIILAAGKGSRFYSKTPKVLHKLCGRTLLDRTIRAVSPFVTSEIIIVAGFGYEQVEHELSMLRESLVGPSIKLVNQAEQKGTGHAAQVGIDAIAEDGKSIIILPGDCPLIDESVISHSIGDMKREQFSVLSFNAEQPFGFGRIIRKPSGTLAKIVEEKDCTEQERPITELNSGIIASRSEVLRKYLPLLTPTNKQGEYYLTDVPELLVADGIDVGVVKVNDSKLVFGANTRSQLSELESMKRAHIVEAFMVKGVTFEDPGAVYIDESVALGEDVFIGAGTRLYGRTQVDSGVTIEGESLIRDSKIGSGSLIRLGCYLDNCKISSQVQIGPFAHIRPHSELADGVKIGNFVETKAAKLGSCVKANHLSYLGDVEIGDNTNIGAGTIVCNYDGVRKSKTLIGENSFIGSNSTLIAPVKVENDSYVAAGSVITSTVPSKALAVGRARQQNYEGWVDKKRSKKS